MQAFMAGTDTSGVLVSTLRILAKVALPQNAHGLRASANLYFIISKVIVAFCLVCYNMANQLPVTRYYNDLKNRTADSTFLIENNTSTTQKDLNGKAHLVGVSNALDGIMKQNEGPSFWHVWRETWWMGHGVLSIYVITLSLFPGYITEDVHSHLLKDWYPLLFIMSYNIFGLVGKSLIAVYMLESSSIAIGDCIARLLFYSLFLACLHVQSSSAMKSPWSFSHASLA